MLSMLAILGVWRLMHRNFTDKDLFPIYEKYEKTYWWYLGRKKILSAVLKRFLSDEVFDKILDIGCGVGEDLLFLEKFGSPFGIDVVKDAIPYWNSKDLKKVAVASGAELPFADGSFSAVAAFDVLEHIEDDEKCIRESYRVTRDGGYLLLTVPAYNFMMAPGYDQQHYRRYCRGALKKILSSEGFCIRKATYFNTLLFPLIFAERLYEKVFHRTEFPYYVYEKLPAAVNRLLEIVFSAEAPALKRIDFPFGSSIFFIAQKASD